jgi:PAS domain S-box-containing protein
MKRLHELELHLFELEMQNEALREAQTVSSENVEKYTQLFDYLPYAYFSVSCDGTILDLNLTGAQILGKERQDLINSHLGFFVAHESKPVFNDFIRRVMNGNTTESCEINMAPNGDLPVCFSCVGTRSRHVEQILITATDITDAKSKSNELVATKEGLKVIFDNAPVIMCIIDRELHVLTANLAFTTFTGLVLEDLRRRRVGEVIGCINVNDLHGECGYGTICMKCDLRLAIADTFATGKGHTNVEYNATIMADGISRNISLLGSTALVHEDKQSHLLLYLYDVTDRRQAEEDTRKIGRYYQAITEKSPDGVVLLNAEGEFKYISESGKRMFGYDPAAEITSNAVDMVHPDDVNMLLIELGTILKDPAYIPTLQYRMIDHSGKWKWVESTFRNLLTDINVESIVINFHDITEQKLAEEKNLLQLKELKRWQDVTLGREDRNRELKQEVNELLALLGQPVRYPSQVKSPKPDTKNETPVRTGSTEY